MKQLSIWAKEHKWASRFIIVLSFISLSFLGMITGLLFDSLDMSLPFFILPGVVFICLLTWIIYPFKKNSADKMNKQKSYVFQKSCDGVLIGLTFIMFVYFGNHQTTPFHSSLFPASAVNTSSLPGDSSKTYLSIAEFKKTMKNENGKPLKWKERKKLMKTQIKAIKNADSLSEGVKVLLIILTVLVAVFLGIGVAALSCSLSCSGSEAAAVIVGIVGYAGIIFLTVLVIKSLRKSRRDKAKAESATPQ